MVNKIKELTQAERDAITPTRQAWLDMTSQEGYPQNFVRPIIIPL